MTSPLRLRAVRPGDIPALYRIALNTGAAGSDATELHADPQLIGHVYVGPYVVLESGFGFVIDDDDGVAGYIVGTVDTRAFEAEAEQQWWPTLRAHYAVANPGLTEADRAMIAEITSPQLAPAALVDDYPATLHTNTLPRLRGRGAGRALIEAYTAEVQRRGAAGIHFGVDPNNEHAVGFYEHVGFSLLSTSADVADTAVWMGRRLAG